MSQQFSKIEYDSQLGPQQIPTSLNLADYQSQTQASWVGPALAGRSGVVVDGFHVSKPCRVLMLPCPIGAVTKSAGEARPYKLPVQPGPPGELRQFGNGSVINNRECASRFSARGDTPRLYLLTGGLEIREHHREDVELFRNFPNLLIFLLETSLGC